MTAKVPVLPWAQRRIFRPRRPLYGEWEPLTLGYMNRIIDKKTRATLLAGLSLGFLSASLHAAMVEGERPSMPSPVAIATTLQAHVGAEGVDVSALLKSPPSLESAAVIEALGDEAKLQALQDYVRSAETAENPALGHAAAGELRKVYEAAQSDAKTRKAVDSARKKLGKKIDAQALNSFFDNNGASGIETVEAEIVDEGMPSHPSGLGRAAARKRRAAAEPPSEGSSLLAEAPAEIVQLSPEDEADVHRIVGQLMTVNPRSVGEFREAVEMVTSWGQSQEDTLTTASAQLDEKMSQGANVQNEVKEQISGLLVEVEKHNPNSLSVWKPSDWMRGLSTYIPGMRKAVISKQSGNTVIDTIAQNVRDTHGRIKDFNDAYWGSIEKTEAAAAEYERMIDKADRVVSDLADRLEKDDSLTPERRQMLADHVLLPLSQRLQDMREEQANNQATIIKGYQTRRNIDRLMGFLKRQETSIPRMLRQSLLESKSLDEQQNALSLVKALNTATAAVILSNSERSKVLSAAINKQARTAMIPATVWQKVLGNAIATDTNNRQEDARALTSTMNNIKMLRQINSQGRQVAHQVMLGTQMRLSLTTEQEPEKAALPKPENDSGQ